MKNRRTILAAFLLVAVLVMGIGFANIADNLDITGKARATTDTAAATFDSKVYFSAVQKLDTSTGNGAGTDTIDILGTEKDLVDFKINTIAEKGQFVAFKITITNESTEFDAVIELDDLQPTGTITNPTGLELSDYFNIVYSIEPGVENKAPITCAAGATVDVYVTVTMTNSPLSTVDASFTSNLTANAVAKAPVVTP